MNFKPYINDDIFTKHQPVMLRESLSALFDNLQVSTPRVFIDATFGRGGHSRAMLKRMSKNDRLLAYDRDLQAISSAVDIQDLRFCIKHQAFAQAMESIVLESPCSISGVLFDLGVSSPQLENAERGFSFLKDGPLDMRMDSSFGISAAQWLESASMQEVTEVISNYGQERFAHSIAKAIVERRQLGAPVKSTKELAKLISAVVKTRERKKHPATRTFQAVRIFINSELEQLNKALHSCLNLLAPGGRLVVISFHSLEDIIVKRFIFQHAREAVNRENIDWMKRDIRQKIAFPLRALSKTRASKAEIKSNPRARSAVMRVAERTSASMDSFKFSRDIN